MLKMLQLMMLMMIKMMMLMLVSWMVHTLLLLGFRFVFTDVYVGVLLLVRGGWMVGTYMQALSLFSFSLSLSHSRTNVTHERGVASPVARHHALCADTISSAPYRHRQPRTIHGHRNRTIRRTLFTRVMIATRRKYRGVMRIGHVTTDQLQARGSNATVTITN